MECILNISSQYVFWIWFVQIFIELNFYSSNCWSSCRRRNKYLDHFLSLGAYILSWFDYFFIVVIFNTFLLKVLEFLIMWNLKDDRLFKWSPGGVEIYLKFLRCNPYKILKSLSLLPSDKLWMILFIYLK